MWGDEMRVHVQFYSYFTDLTGTAECEEELHAGATLEELLQRLHQRFPRLRDMAKSTLIAVGVEYQPRQYTLQPGDEVALFPPVQGG
jgi:MoaD family protein